MAQGSTFAVMIRQARIVAAELIAAFWPGQSGPEVAQRIERLPMRAQAGVLTGVLGLLFLVSLFAAQFGLVGMALFLAAVFLIIS
ncbi:hypothetical protein [Thetidibacter halocola]|uniref:Uncharacterized protein n=1 Tax=Thetidibacter halocola TaxID=2827239 RepID=A0A8J7WD59_9RHOB|nr:hypothetical protein [Thetidibacter halocola]MBS0122983.1 hypothetical protein [Thetidibacter halocola]